MKEEDFWKRCFKVRTRYMIETFVLTARAVIEKFGDEGREAIKKGRYNVGFNAGKRIAKIAEEQGREKNLDTFLELMHSEELPWSSTPLKEKTESRAVAEIPYCPIAAILKEMNAEDLGDAYCAWDDGIVAGFSEKMKIENPKFLWAGDPCCIHIWELKE